MYIKLQIINNPSLFRSPESLTWLIDIGLRPSSCVFVLCVFKFLLKTIRPIVLVKAIFMTRGSKLWNSGIYQHQGLIGGPNMQKRKCSNIFSSHTFEQKTKCLVIMFMKTSTQIVKLLVSESGIHARANVAIWWKLLLIKIWASNINCFGRQSQ